MTKMYVLLVIIKFFFISVPALCQEEVKHHNASSAISATPSDSNSVSDSVKDKLTSFKNIVFDVRGSRGGHGDVGASYLTALDMVKRLGYPGTITFIMEDREGASPGSAARILGKLLGRPPLTSGTTAYGGKIRFLEISKIPRDFPSVDLYLSLANPRGMFYFQNDFRHSVEPVEKAKSDPLSIIRAAIMAKRKGIPIDNNTVLISQTVLGNTENDRSAFWYGTVAVGDTKFDMQPAGLAKEESGIYVDSMASALRGQSDSQVRSFVRSAAGQIDDSKQRQMILSLVGARDGSYLQGSKLGLAYGITDSQVKGQYATYLKSLQEDAQKTGKSYTILTPSGFSNSDVSPELASHIEIITSADALPRKAVPGKIYIVKTGTLPHRVFVGLMALSEIPPVVAGDGAMSAAIGLGKPFVMTRVVWNSENIANMGATLQETQASLSPELKTTLQSLFPSSELHPLSLQRALELNTPAAKQAFDEAGSKLLPFTDSLINAAQTVHVWNTTPKDELPPSTFDQATTRIVSEAKPFQFVKKTLYTLSQDPWPEELWKEVPSFIRDSDPIMKKDILYALSQQPHWPEEFWKEVPSFIRNPIVRDDILFALLKQPHWPESIWKEISALLRNPDQGVIDHIFQILFMKSSWPEELWKQVPSLLKDPDPGLRDKILFALSKQSSWPQDVWKEIPSLLKDPNPGLRTNILTGLSNQSSWPQDVWKEVSALLRDPDPRQRIQIVMALDNQSSLPENIWKEIPSMMRDPNENINYWITLILHNQSSWPENVWKEIPSMMRDPNNNVRESIARALSRKSSWPELIWKEIPDLLRDPGLSVRSGLITGLSKQPHWPEEFLKELPTLMQELDPNTKEQLSKALQKHLDHTSSHSLSSCIKGHFLKY